MTRRAWYWASALAIGDAVAWLLTLPAQANYHSEPGGPSTTLGIVLGWIISIGLFIVTTLVVLGARQARAYRYRPAPGSARPTPNSAGPMENGTGNAPLS